MNVLAIIPWLLFVVTVFFTMFFIVWAWRAARRARDATGQVSGLQQQLQHMEARAIAAEAQIESAVQAANIAEQKVAHADERVAKARDAARQAQAQADEAARAADDALNRARQADSALQQRRDAAAEQQRQAEQRAQALFSWAQQQWETRRETDRQTAQGEHGSFQAQLEKYLSLRAVPVSFRVTNEMDRMAAPNIPRYASGQTVTVEGDLVTVQFPVDASLGFRA